MNQRIEVLIIGGGQAGLAIGFQLSKKNIKYLIIDANEKTGDSWRKRFDSMTLFTSRAYCSLPGKNILGKSDGYPTKDEMADYLEDYTSHFGLNIEHKSKAIKLTKTNSIFSAQLENGKIIEAVSVVIAAGAFQKPLALDEHSITVPTYTILTYRNAAQIPEGTVLIVGDGATGRQIALDMLSEHRIILSTGKKRNIIPQRLIGHDIFHWLDKIGILWANSNSIIAKIVRKRDPFPGKHLDLKLLQNKGVTIFDRFIRVEGNTAIFNKGDPQKIDAIVWAMGYENETQWLQIPKTINEDKSYTHKKGLSPIEGLCYMGLPWQTCRASALVAGLNKDSSYISNYLENHLSTLTSN